VALTGEAFRALMSPIVNSGHPLDSLYAFLYLGWDILERWSVTAVIVGAASGTLGYLIGLHVQKGHCRRKAQELGVTYEKLLEKLEQSLGKGHNRRTGA
jgi:hypothetical protein